MGFQLAQSWATQSPRRVVLDRELIGFDSEWTAQNLDLAVRDSKLTDFDPRWTIRDPKLTDFDPRWTVRDSKLTDFDPEWTVRDLTTTDFDLRTEVQHDIEAVHMGVAVEIISPVLPPQCMHAGSYMWAETKYMQSLHASRGVSLTVHLCIKTTCPK